jgi:stress response protein SCP2
VRTFVRGEKAKLGDLTSSQVVSIAIVCEGPDTYDVSCFGLDAAGQLSDDRYFIFFNQPSSPEGSITSSGPSGLDASALERAKARLYGNNR